MDDRRRAGGFIVGIEIGEIISTAPISEQRAPRRGRNFPLASNERGEAYGRARNGASVSARLALSSEPRAAVCLPRLINIFPILI